MSDQHVLMRVEASGLKHEVTHFQLKPGEKVKVHRLNQTVYSTAREPADTSGTNQEGS